MASPRTVAIAFVFLVLVAASAPSSVVGARMMPEDDGRQERVTAGDGETVALKVSTAVARTPSSSLQEALVQRPPLPLPMSPPTMKTSAVFQRRSSRMLGSVPSPGVGH
uniref:Uncharacterized protein n=1 Tax=Avena sativa TaxID=4498 RepID=A0ACD5VLT9_AVESA